MKLSGFYPPYILELGVFSCALWTIRSRVRAGEQLQRPRVRPRRRGSSRCSSPRAFQTSKNWGPVIGGLSNNRLAPPTSVAWLTSLPIALESLREVMINRGHSTSAVCEDQVSDADHKNVPKTYQFFCSDRANCDFSLFSFDGAELSRTD